jgi:hypothetical protein
MQVETIQAKVGIMSLIGTDRGRPVHWGNYFSFTNGMRCLNMWAENLQSAVPLYLLDGLVEVAVWDSRYAIVIDPRIPKDWLYQKLCFTGCRAPSVVAAREMFEVVDNPSELEQFTDPVSYYAKRGQRFDPVTNTIYASIESPPKKLEAKWSSAPIRTERGVGFQEDLFED